MTAFTTCVILLVLKLAKFAECYNQYILREQWDFGSFYSLMGKKKKTKKRIKKKCKGVKHKERFLEVNSSKERLSRSEAKLKKSYSLKKFCRPYSSIV